MVKETETEEGRKQVAEHILLTADGSEAESEEQAQGVRYKLLENGKTFTWNWSEANDSEKIMLACFGAKTLATNVTSAARNNKKNPANAEQQFTELEERFALIRGGQWVDRTREPGAPRVDRDKLAAAIVQVMLKGGKITADQESATLQEKRERLDSDAAYLTMARQIPAVAEAYNELTGRATATVDQL